MCHFSYLKKAFLEVKATIKDMFIGGEDLEADRPKTSYFVNKLIIMLYSKYIFLLFFYFWNERVHFLTLNMMMSFSQVEKSNAKHISTSPKQYGCIK